MPKLQTIWNRLKQFGTSGDALVFVLFLFISTILWFSRVQNNQQHYSIIVPIQYTGLTPEVRLNDSLPKELKISVIDNNNQFFLRKVKIPLIPIDLTTQVSKKQRNINVSAARLQQTVKDQLPANITISQIEPSNIQAQATYLRHKDVEIKFSGKITPAPQYQLSDDIELNPSVITIYGTKETLDTIKQIETKYTSIENVSKLTTEQLQLIVPKGVNIEQTTTTLQVDAYAFTEKRINVPLQVVGQPDNTSIKLFPATVEIKLLLPVQIYQQFNPKAVRAMVNFNEMQNSTNGIVKVYVAAENNQITILKTTPETVEFMIELTTNKEQEILK